ncbi:MAG: hypothetical protein AB1657_02775 [Candidatus Micrarchaeota archaeon]
MREPLVEMPKRKNEMPDAVKVAVVRAGAFYICSEEVLKVLAPRVQYMEFAEQYGDREREERTTYGGKHADEVRGETLKRFGEMLAKATDEGILEFLKKGYLEIPKDKWGSETVRRAAVKALIAFSGNDARKIMRHDFNDNGLRAVLRYYGDSPHKALVDAGFDVKPWEMSITPRGFFGKRENRIEAIKWLVGKLRKKPEEVITDDFGENGLNSLIHYYGGSPYKAMRDAGFELNAWDMTRVPRRFYQNVKNRREAVRWLVGKLGKEPKDMTRDDFVGNGLGWLVRYYRGSPYEALLDAGLVTEADEEYMRSTQHTHKGTGNGKPKTDLPSPPSEGVQN